MTRDDLTKGYVRKIAAEIKRAFNYLGEYEEEFIREFAEKQIDELWCDLAGCGPERIETEDGMVVGYSITVGIGGLEGSKEIMRNGKMYEVENLQTLELIVNEKEFQYVLKSIDVYDLKGIYMQEYEYGNIKYKKVKLEDVDKTVIHRAF